MAQLCSLSDLYAISEAVLLQSSLLHPLAAGWGAQPTLRRDAHLLKQYAPGPVAAMLVLAVALVVAPLWAALRQWPIISRIRLGRQCSKLRLGATAVPAPACTFCGPQAGRAAFCTGAKLHLPSGGPLKLHRHPPAMPPSSLWVCLQVRQMPTSCRGTELTLPIGPSCRCGMS